MSTKCVRCPKQPAHELGTGCDHTTKQQVHNMHNRILQFWPTCSEVGEKTASPGDVFQSEKLLLDFSSGKEIGEPYTKWLLENAFQKLYQGKKGKSQADIERANQKSKQARSDHASSSASQQRGKSGSVPKIPTKSPGFSADANQAHQTASKNQKLVFSPAARLPPRDPAKEYTFAVHQDKDLDERFARSTPNDPGRFGDRGEATSVATNYVAVSKVPGKIYMYSIEFGTIAPVKTKRQTEEDQKADSLNKVTTGTAALSITQDGGSSASASSGAVNDGNSDRRKITQHSEKSRILKALGGMAPLQDIPHATDTELLWTLKPLDDTEMTVSDVVYQKLSGRKYCVDSIAFRFTRALDIPSSGREGSRSLINSQDVNKKGGSMRATALNAFISQRVSLNANVIAVGSNKIFVKAGYEPAENMLNIHRGYFSSIRPGLDSILLNVNVATSAFFQPLTAAEMYRNIRLNRGYGDPKQLLKGLTVRIGYNREKHDEEYDPNLEENRLRTIAGFGVIPSQQMFELDGKMISVEDHFRQNLGALPLRYGDLECISVTVAPPKSPPPANGDQNKKDKGKSKQSDDKTKKVQPMWIPPEYLQICPYQPFTRLLLNDHTEKMIKVALRHPAANQNLIMTEGFSLLGIGQQPSPFEQVGLHVGDKFLRVPARILRAPNILYGRDRRADVSQGSWNFKNLRFFHPGNNYLHNPIFTMDMRTKPGSATLQDLGDQLARSMQNYGIDSPRPQNRTQNYVNLISMLPKDWSDKTIHDIMQTGFANRKGPILLVILLSDKDPYLYGQMKRVCDQWSGYHTVCLVEGKLKGGDKNKFVSPQQLGNLALKFNIKLGGQNHQVAVAGPIKPSNKPDSAFRQIANDTIVMGADVSHPSGGLSNMPSIAAVVASYDQDFTHFSASMRLQAGTQEMIDEFEDMVYYRLVYFAEKRGSLPTRMLFYRDGLSEDQFQECRLKEIGRIETAFNRACRYAADKLRINQKGLSAGLKLTFIVVGKRHHTRFYACDDKDTYADKQGEQPSPNRGDNKLNGNVKPGLVVDRVITRPSDDGTLDFFLQSHAALKGTARSAHYLVLHNDDMNIGPLQVLTYAFCHNYMRATKAVSYAVPAYYADRLCDRGAHYLRGIPEEHFDIQMNDTEMDMEKRKGQKAYLKRVAETLSTNAYWMPPGNTENGREPNPWHPSFDGRMFWL